MQLHLDLRLDLLPSDRQHFRDRTVADDLAHDRLVHRAERVLGVAHLEEVLIRIRHAILDDPFDDGDVEVAGQHHRLVAEVLLGVLRADRRLDGAKAELLFQLTLDGDLRDRFRERDLHVQSRVGGADVAAEPEHDADRLGLDLIERARENDED